MAVPNLMLAADIGCTAGFACVTLQNCNPAALAHIFDSSAFSTEPTTHLDMFILNCRLPDLMLLKELPTLPQLQRMLQKVRAAA